MLLSFAVSSFFSAVCTGAAVIFIEIATVYLLLLKRMITFAAPISAASHLLDVCRLPAPSDTIKDTLIF